MFYIHLITKDLRDRQLRGGLSVATRSHNTLKSSRGCFQPFKAVLNACKTDGPRDDGRILRSGALRTISLNSSGGFHLIASSELLERLAPTQLLKLYAECRLFRLPF